MKYSIKRTTEPASEPITASESKNHLRVPSGDTADDDKIALLLSAARQQVERDIRQSLIQQTWTIKFDDFDLEFRLPYGPVQSVTSVKYIDDTGTQQTASSGDYTLDAYSNPAVVRLDWDATWPSHRGDKRGVEIIYVAGYANAASVPDEIKAAILLRLESLYDGETPQLKSAYEHLVQSLREGSYP